MSATKDIIGQFFHGDIDFAGLRDGLVSLFDELPAEREFVQKSLDALRRMDKLDEAEYDELIGLIGDEAEAEENSGGDATVFSDSTMLLGTTQLLDDSGVDPDSTGYAPDESLVNSGTFIASASISQRSQIPRRSAPTSGRSTRAGSFDNLQYDADRPMPVVGDSLKDRFVLAKMVGQGGMGLVYKALDLRKEEAHDRDPYLALKILSEEFKKHPDSLIALQREARKSQMLAHPNVVNVYDFDRDGDTVYMTMEFMDGLPLDQVIERRVAVPISPEDAINYVKQMSAGLAYAHAQGVVHSDFKPGNVFLTDDGTIKILDFGIARATKNVGPAKDDNTVFDAESLGALTPAYASLDMLIGEEPDPSDDIYALGCTAYELLSGRHPFAKKPAKKAHELGMEPVPLTNINRNQWRAIAAALEFKREDRVSTVKEFVEMLDETWDRKWGLHLAAGAAVATIVLAIGFSIPGQLKEQELRDLGTELASGDVRRVYSALDEVAELNEPDQQVVLSGASNALLRFFDGRANEAFAVEQERYDFRTASAAFQRALSLYDFNDAAVQVVQGRLDDLETRKNRLLNDFDSEFTGALEVFEEGNYSAADTLFDVLGRVEEVDPEHPLLTDGRLPPAFAGVARRAVDAGDYDKARDLLHSIVPRFPDDATLREELGRVDLEERRVTQTVQVFLLEAEVTGLRLAARSVEDLPALGEAADRLAEIAPGNSEIDLAQRQASTVVAAGVDDLLADFRFADAQDLLAGNTSYMEVGSIEALTNHIASSKTDRENSLNTMMATLRSSAAAGNIGEGSEAAAALAALEEARADTVLLTQAQAVLFEAYIQSANTLRSDGDWDTALTTVAEAYTYATSDEDTQRLATAALQIDRARTAEQSSEGSGEGASQEQMHASEIERLAALFNTTIAGSSLGAAEVQSALDLVEQLAAIDPANPIVSDGREAIAQRLVERARPLRASQQFQAARQVVVDGLSLLPASASLSNELQAIALQEQEAAALARESRIARLRDDISDLLRNPTFEADWDALLRSRLDELEAAGAVNADESAALRQQIAETFANEAVSARKESRFADARLLIDSGRHYLSDYPRWSNELNLIAAGEEDFQRRTAVQAVTARLDGVKQTLRTQAAALDVQAAADTLKRLQELAPDDPFVVTEGPEQLAAAYQSLSDMALREGAYGRAASLASDGLELTPSNAALSLNFDVARRELIKQAIIDALSGGSQQSPSELRENVATLQKLAGGAFSRDVRFMTEQIASRLTRLSQSDPDRAQALWAEAMAQFPDAQALLALDLG